MQGYNCRRGLFDGRTQLENRLDSRACDLPLKYCPLVHGKDAELPRIGLGASAHLFPARGRMLDSSESFQRLWYLPNYFGGSFKDVQRRT